MRSDRAALTALTLATSKRPRASATRNARESSTPESSHGARSVAIDRRSETRFGGDDASHARDIDRRLDRDGRTE